MIKRTEQFLPLGPNQQILHLQKWSNSEKEPQKILLITHGVAEHSDCYHQTAEAWAEQGMLVYAWDLPGHGKSYGARGYISAFDEFTANLFTILNYVQTQNTTAIPLFLFGHSLGGLITIKFILDYSNASYQGVCLSSPALGVKVEVPFIKDQAARFLFKWAPTFTIPHELNFDDLSRDRDLTRTYAKDPLRHKKFSAPLYLGILETMKEVHSKAQEVTCPVLMQLAGDDRIVDSLASQEFFVKLSSVKKEMKIYPESYHEIFNDLNKQEVIDDLLHFLRQS